jgi:hypothetical protein
MGDSGSEQQTRGIRDHLLGLVAGLLFLGTLVGQAFAGWSQFNDSQHAEGLGRLGLGEYLFSADFAVDVSENWQSEYLQFLVFILITIWFVQRGSTESKTPGEEGFLSDKEQRLGAHLVPGAPKWARAGGWRTRLYSWSLVLMMAAIFVASWATQLVAGWASFNETRLQRLQDPLSVGGYFLHADFWSRTLQNWQSEFLAVGSMAVLSIYLRQRGSPESKPVGEPHDSTGASGG